MGEGAADLRHLFVAPGRVALYQRACDLPHHAAAVRESSANLSLQGGVGVAPSLQGSTHPVQLPSDPALLVRSAPQRPLD